MARHRLTDEQWDAIADVFPPPAATGRPPCDRRNVVDGIFWIMRTGSPWRDMPEEIGTFGNRMGLVRQMERRRQTGRNPLPSAFNERRRGTVVHRRHDRSGRAVCRGRWKKTIRKNQAIMH